MTVGVCQTTFLDYDGFVRKFEAKKTTDDCYTPPAVYEAVVNWCRGNCGLKPDTQIIRPFWPGGDYERQNYPSGSVVIDNPPFSICKKIIDFYLSRDIKFFLFVPGLTCFWPSLLDACLIIIHKTIQYENGARVCTAFCTNLLPYRLVLSGSLDTAITACQPSKAKPPHILPPNTYSAGQIKKFTPKNGTFTPK